MFAVSKMLSAFMNNVLRQAGTAINKEKKNRNVLHLVQILQEV